MNITKLIIISFSIVTLSGGCSSNSKIYTIPKYSSAIVNYDKSDLTKSFILIGDTQKTGWMEEYFLFRESNDSVQFKIFEKISALETKPAFIIHLGDMVYEGASYEDWEYFDDFTSEVRDMNVPILPLLGNHEYMGDNETMLELATNRFVELKDSSWRSFEFNGIGFVLLNSNPELSQSMIDKQKEWYKYQMDFYNKDKNVKNIVVATHHPPFTNGTGIGFGDSEYIKEDFVPLFKNNGKAKLFISGHCHSYEHLLIDGKHFIVSGGGGGPRRSLDLEGDYNDITEGIEKNVSDRDFNFVEVTVDNGFLIFKTHIFDKDSDVWDIGDEFRIPN